MSSPIDIPQDAQPRLATGDEPQRPRFNPYTGEPVDELEPAQGSNFWSQQKAASEPIHVAPTIPDAPHNKYAPTGWQRKHRVEVDVNLPSGQLARIMRLEREDLFRLNLMSYLDTFTPMLMEDTISSEERSKRIRETMSNKPDAIANMFMAIDEVVMAATIRPRVTDEENKVDYGNQSDWGNPSFIATALISDITMEDRFAIFAASFGRSMDDLKSLWEQTPSVASVADQPGVQSDSQ